MLRLSLALALAATIASVPPRAPGSIDWAQVDRAMGKMGALQPGDVYRYAFPRSDLDVTVDGVTLEPALALGGWVAFKATGDNEAMAMGDIVLRDDEVGPVMLTLRKGGVEQTALHNHLLRESPAILYMHIRAHGDPRHIAGAMGVATGINIQPTTNGRGVATGDFVLTAAEVNPVIQALTANGIAVTAVHSHI